MKILAAVTTALAVALVSLGAWLSGHHLRPVVRVAPAIAVTVAHRSQPPVCPGDPQLANGVVREVANGRTTMQQWLAAHRGQYFANIESFTVLCGPGWQQTKQADWFGGLLEHPAARMPAGMVFYAARS